MAKRPHESLNNSVQADLNAPKYRRVAPKQGVDINTYSDSSQGPSEVFGGRPSPLSNQSYGVANFPQQLSASTPTFPMAAQTREPNANSSNQWSSNPPSSQPAATPPVQPIKFETALEFLDQVKQQFEDSPRVYKQFLRIMKDFKLHEIDTPGVILRVSELFHGHDHLILGFNRFLPEGYKITQSDIQRSSAQQPYMPSPTSYPQLSDAPVRPPSTRAYNQYPDLPASLLEASKKPVAPPTRESPSTVEIEASGMVPAVVPQESPSPIVSAPAALTSDSQGKKQPELEHARNYVKKIKVRFESQPNVYKSFLRILHTFHEEHNTINNVYDQVAVLFKNHADLLREFKQFLPDTTQSSPRTRRAKSTRKKKADSYSPSIGANDYNFFDSAKSQLRTEPTLHEEFLKALRFFNEGIFSQIDLLAVVRDLFSEYPELYTEFRQFCEWEDIPPSMISSHSPSSDESPIPIEETPMVERNEIDFSKCKRYGLSYRALPETFVPQPCSARTDMCYEVLNDQWISLPTGSEEGFKASRKNVFEQNLFTCEDLRYELDMTIEINTSTIMAFNNVLKELEECPEDQLPSFKLECGLDVIHMRSIERIYGAKGPLIIQCLSENPAVALPIVLRRLRQKDAEWRASRVKWSRLWQEMNEKNYFRSLDHQSTNFKHKDRKFLNPRELLADINHTFAPDEDTDIPPVKSFTMKETVIFQDIAELIQHQAEKTCNSACGEPEKLTKFVQSFVGQFFVSSAESGSNTFGLFFGNNSFYVFFRFYQLLYERLLDAKSQAAEAFANQRPEKNTKSIMASFSNSEPKPRFKSADEIYRYYLERLTRLIDGTLDAAKYEDICREVLGINSFSLFTMDRLLQVLVKQILSIFLEETSSELLSLHSYEAARSKEFLESIYHAHALKITGEERCFKFKYVTPEGEFSIQLLDDAEQPSIVELQPRNTSGEDNSPSDGNIMLDDLSSDSPLLNRHHNVFLKRNQRKTSESPELNQDITVNNGLECKICTSTFRHFYVEETEDFFYRSGRLSAARSHRCKGTQKLHNWVNARLGL